MLFIEWENSDVDLFEREIRVPPSLDMINVTIHLTSGGLEGFVSNF